MIISIPCCRSIIGIRSVGMVVYLCAVLLLIGCSAVPHTYVIKIDSSGADYLKKATLEVALRKDRFLTLIKIRNVDIELGIR